MNLKEEFAKIDDWVRQAKKEGVIPAEEVDVLAQARRSLIIRVIKPEEIE